MHDAPRLGEMLGDPPRFVSSEDAAARNEKNRADEAYKQPHQDWTQIDPANPLPPPNGTIEAHL